SGPEHIRLKSDPTTANKIERSDTDENPQQYALRERTPADLLQRCAGDSRPDQKQCDGEPKTPKLKKHLRQARLLRAIRVDHRSDAKKKNKPRNLDFGFAAPDSGGSKRQRHDPKSSREFHGCSGHQRLAAV